MSKLQRPSTKNRRKPQGTIGLHRRVSLRVTRLAIADLVLDPGNPRAHSERQVKQLAKSIEAFGFVQPVLIDGKRRVIAGHGRIKAATLLGLDHVPTICLHHLSESQLRALVIADNKLAEQAVWDQKLLAEQMRFLSEAELDFDLEATGFDIGEIDLLIEGLSPAGRHADSSADKLPKSKPSRLVSQPSDVWCANQHRVYLGSSLEPANFSSLMQGRKAAASFIDPPSKPKVAGSVDDLNTIKDGVSETLSGGVSEDKRFEYLTQAFGLLATHSIDGSLHYVCFDWRHLSVVVSAGKKLNWKALDLCVWNKGTSGMGSLYRSQHGLIFVFKNGEAAAPNNLRRGPFGRCRTNVWDYPGPSKSIALVSDVLMDCAARNEIVLDTFLGTGTTLIAAERTGRVCYGIEVDPFKIDTALRRWQKLTGRDAVHAASGRTFNELEKEASHEPRQ